MSNTFARVFLETMPLLVGVGLTYLFWRDKILLTLLYLLAIATVLKVKYYPGDFLALAYGLVLGLFVEVVGTTFAGYQKFANPDMLGIPIWLPISWAYGLMLMKRIGIIIYESRKKLCDCPA
jgi:hypothetical protein